MAEGEPVIVSPPDKAERTTGTGYLSRRMIIIAAGWITLLLIAGGLALDRVLVNAVSDNFDDQMEYVRLSRNWTRWRSPAKPAAGGPTIS